MKQIIGRLAYAAVFVLIQQLLKFRFRWRQTRKVFCRQAVAFASVPFPSNCHIILAVNHCFNSDCIYALTLFCGPCGHFSSNCRQTICLSCATPCPLFFQLYIWIYHQSLLHEYIFSSYHNFLTQALLAVHSCVHFTFAFQFLLTRMNWSPSSNQVDSSVKQLHILHHKHGDFPWRSPTTDARY